MNVGFYNPYHNTLGGGEYYLFLMMKQFLPDHTVVYFSDQKDCIEKAENQFSIQLKGIQVHNIFQNSPHPFDRISKTSQFDKLFWYSDGSIPFSAAKETYLIFQFPVPWVKKSILTRTKLLRVTTTIVNSKFTKQSIDATYGINSKVVYPAIDASQFTPKKKEKIIVSIGRFTQGMNTKRQDILIRSFKSLIEKGIKDWKLHIVGGVLPQDESFVNELKGLIQGYPIEIHENYPRAKVVELLNKASIYWHASGFEANDKEHPEQVEHFGISIVEAMAAGAIPFVYNAGGPPEIVVPECGIVWNTIDELISSTVRYMQSSDIVERMREHAINRAKNFDLQHFRESFSSVLSGK